MSEKTKDEIQQEKLNLVQKRHYIKVISIDARKKGTLKSGEKFTVSRFTNYLSEVNLTTKAEILAPDWSKNISGQSLETLEMLYRKVNYTPVSLLEKQYDFALLVGQKTKSIRDPHTLGFNACLEFLLTDGDVNELNQWSCGVLPNYNSLANQNFSFNVKKGS